MTARRQVDVLFDISDYKHSQPAMEASSTSPSDADRNERQARFRAASRIRRLAISPREQRNAGWTSAEIVDHRTAMADARIALCAAMGNSLDDIDPSSGYSMSQSSYDNARQSWISSIKYHGFNPMYDQVRLAQAFAFWQERRPESADGDDWLAAGLKAHRDYWQGIDTACRCPTCVEDGETPRPAA